MAPLAHSSAAVNHPVKQGFWGIVEVFVDTIVVCTMTALVVLSTGVWDNGVSGAALTVHAFGVAFGSRMAGTIFVTAIIVFFAFTTALVNVYYGEICVGILGGKKFVFPYRVLGCVFAIVGAVGALQTLWTLFDFFFGTCAVCNLVVCFLMRKQIGALIKDYLSRLKSGKWTATAEEAAAGIPELRLK
jgi:AGCS family alanine or glycine:cation symporter